EITQTTSAGTAAQYDRAWNAFAQWCNANNTDPLSNKEADVVNFLYAHYAHSGQTLNVYRSAIASVWNIYFDTQPLAERPAVKALFTNKRKKGAPPAQRRHIWKVSDAIHRLELDGAPELLSDADLAARTAFLMALATIWRPRSDLGRLQYCDVEFIGPSDAPTGMHLFARTTKEGGTKSATIQRLPGEHNVCPVRYAAAYAARTDARRAELSTDHTFFITS
ncbi:hypothetical protein COEREDRAFT_27510, partial [Coemansia reversa NRRL 1564]